MSFKFRCGPCTVGQFLKTKSQPLLPKQVAARVGSEADLFANCDGEISAVINVPAQVEGDDCLETVTLVWKSQQLKPARLQLTGSLF